MTSKDYEAGLELKSLVQIPLSGNVRNRNARSVVCGPSPFGVGAFSSKTLGSGLISQEWTNYFEGEPMLSTARCLAIKSCTPRRAIAIIFVN